MQLKKIHSVTALRLHRSAEQILHQIRFNAAAIVAHLQPNLRSDQKGNRDFQFALPFTLLQSIVDQVVSRLVEQIARDEFLA